MEQALATLDEGGTPPEQASSGWTLQKLNTRHKQAASLLAQGCKRGEIAAIVQYSEEYLSFLVRQPLFRNYVREMTKYSEERLVALFEDVVDVIADTMRNGTEEGRLKAARLQMEATGRIGRERSGRDDKPEDDSLNTLAERLVTLMRRKQNAVLEGDFTKVTDAEELGSSISDDSEEDFRDASLLERPNETAQQVSTRDSREPALGIGRQP